MDGQVERYILYILLWQEINLLPILFPLASATFMVRLLVVKKCLGSNCKSCAALQSGFTVFDCRWLQRASLSRDKLVIAICVCDGFYFCDGYSFSYYLYS